MECTRQAVYDYCNYLPGQKQIELWIGKSSRVRNTYDTGEMVRTLKPWQGFDTFVQTYSRKWESKITRKKKNTLGRIFEKLDGRNRTQIGWAISIPPEKRVEKLEIHVKNSIITAKLRGFLLEIQNNFLQGQSPPVICT